VIGSARPVALVTGGSSGIGLALAERLAERGMTVLLAARGEERLQEAAARVPGSDPLPADVSEPADRELLIAAVRRHGRLDLLVNNAGVGGGTTAVDIDVARASRVLEVNFLAHVALTRALWVSLLASGGAIVNVSSALGTYANPGSAAYSSSKHALTAWSRALRIQGLRQGVRVLTLNPGPVSTAQFPHAEMARRRLARHLLIDAGRCADDALRGLDRNRAEVWSHPAYRLLASAQAIAPGLFARRIAACTL
jgi:short-subunit dehydrogenase